MGSNQSTQNQKGLQKLKQLEEVIFNLNSKNLNESIVSSFTYFDQEYPYSFYLIICRLLYSYFISKGCGDICLEYIKKLEIKEKEIFNNNFRIDNKTNNKVIRIFAKFLLSIDTQESNYLLEKMIEEHLIDPKIYKLIYKQKRPYFAHLISIKEIWWYNQYSKFYNNFHANYEELSKNNWKLHKQLIKEGHNPNEIAKIIRKDEIEKLQEISSQTNLDFNQKIRPSLYERCSFINEENVSLIDYAAFFGSVKCFKYLLMNNANVHNTGKYAVAGGNLEIIHLCEQNHSSFENAFKTAIMFHRNDIFKYLYDNNFDNYYLPPLAWECVSFDNYKILSYMERKEGMEFDESFIKDSLKTDNLFLIQYLLEKNPVTLNIFNPKLFSNFCNIELFKYLNKNGHIIYKNIN